MPRKENSFQQIDTGTLVFADFSIHGVFWNGTPADTEVPLYTVCERDITIFIALAQGSPNISAQGLNHNIRAFKC